MASVENPYAAPVSELQQLSPDVPIMRRRRYVVLDKSASWPKRCVCCNEPADVHKRFRFSYVTPWIFISLLINVLLTVFLYFLFRKRFTCEIPYCNKHAQRRRKLVVLTWVLVLLTVVVVVFGAANLWVMPVLPALVISLFVLSGVFATQAYQLQVVKYKKNKLWISGVGKAFLGSLPEYE